MKSTETQIRELSKWVDDYPPNKARDPEAQLYGRVAKVFEEAGEIMDAMIGCTDQNPRKGVYCSIDDVEKELFDTALSALGAVEHINGNDGSAMMKFVLFVAKVHERAGLTG